MMLRDQDNNGRDRLFFTRDYPEEITRSRKQLQLVLKEGTKIDSKAHLSRERMIDKGMILYLTAAM